MITQISIELSNELLGILFKKPNTRDFTAKISTKAAALTIDLEAAIKAQDIQTFEFVAELFSLKVDEFNNRQPLFYVQNKTNSRWLKTDGNSYSFYPDQKGAALFTQKKAQEQINRFTATAGYFNYAIIPQ